MKPLIVGEGPSPRWVGRPLFGNPTRVLCDVAGIEPGRSGYHGHRRDLLLYVQLRTMARLENLCVGAWDRREAEVRAMSLAYGLRDGATIVMLGRRVARTFGTSLPFFEPGTLYAEIPALVLPHPSGLNRMYNDPSTRARVGAALRGVLSANVLD